MSATPSTGKDPQPTAAASPPATEESSAVRLGQMVRALLADCGPKVAEMVVDLTVAEEREKRVALVRRGLARLRELKAELAKLTPDSIVYDSEDPTKVKDVLGYSPQRAAEVGKKRSEVVKIEQAIERCLNPEFSDSDPLVKLFGSDKTEDKS